MSLRKVCVMAGKVIRPVQKRGNGWAVSKAWVLRSCWLGLLGFLFAFSKMTAATEAPELVIIDDDTPDATNLLFWSDAERRRAFPRIAETFPTRTILSGDKASVLGRRDFDWSKFSYRYKKQNRSMQDYIEVMQAAGILVLQDNRILFENYAHGHSESLPWVSFSVSKSLVSMLYGLAIADGYINSTEDLVTEYVPRLRGTAYGDVTIAQLLQMSSGIAWNEDYTDPEADVVLAPSGTLALVDYMGQLPRTGEPGTQFTYNTGETNMAGMVLRAALGNNLSEYLSRRLWQPLGMEADANWMLDQAHGVEFGGCCISATLRDYARLGGFALNDGRLPDGRQWLPAEWMAQSTAASPAFAGYGYYWWLMSPTVFAAQGIYGQTIWIDRANDLVIVLHSVWPVAWSDDHEAHMTAFLNAVSEHVSR